MVFLGHNPSAFLLSGPQAGRQEQIYFILSIWVEILPAPFSFHLCDKERCREVMGKVSSLVVSGFKVCSLFFFLFKWQLVKDPVSICSSAGFQFNTVFTSISVAGTVRTYSVASQQGAFRDLL